MPMRAPMNEKERKVLGITSAVAGGGLVNMILLNACDSRIAQNMERAVPFMDNAEGGINVLKGISELGFYGGLVTLATLGCYTLGRYWRRS